MNAVIGTLSASQPIASSVDAMAAEDLRALAWLHEIERKPTVLSDLYHSGFPQTLSLLPPEHVAVTQMVAALSALAEMPKEDEHRCTDDLAADYAGIYLTHAMRAAPYESVWRDEDQLMMQGPTFAVREFYQSHGMVVHNWRHMPDDHISHQLNFVAVLIERGELKEAARFLKTHLLTWLPLFTKRVEERSETSFYTALATLTLACSQECLNRLPHVTVIPPVKTATANQSVCSS